MIDPTQLTTDQLYFRDPPPKDTTNGAPMFPEGTRVYSYVFNNPGKTKMVLHAVWRGAEYYYTLIDDEGVEDEGYLAKDLSVAIKLKEKNT